MPEANLRVTAKVLEGLPHALYRVELQREGRPEVTAHVPPGVSLLRVRPGDLVTVELSAYDPGRGRIVSAGPAGGGEEKSRAGEGNLG